MIKDFQNKKILILGLGLHGGGVAVANWFLRQGAKVRITDLKTGDQLAASIQKIIGEVDRYTLGRHETEDILWADLVVQNPAVPRESGFIRLAREHQIAVENEASLFIRIVGRSRIIGVTGTRGKSTTATLIYHILKKRYPRALIGGNIVTAPMFQIIDEALLTHDPIVLELSSWHLESLGERRLSPHIAVFTNLYPDHLNRYQNMEDYGLAKRNIFEHQNVNDIVVLNHDNDYTQSLEHVIRSKAYWFSRRKSHFTFGTYIRGGWIYFCDAGSCLAIKDIRIPGGHNIENILAAVCVGKILEVSDHAIGVAVRAFTGLPHRLELVGQVAGVEYYNDTTATSPDGVLSALAALGIKRNIVLIAGGADKGFPQQKMAELARAIEQSCKAVVLLDGTGTKRLLEERPDTVLCSEVKNMTDAVGLAQGFARRGDRVVLSPGFASFGMFVHEFDRGDQFRRIVEGLAPKQ